MGCVQRAALRRRDRVERRPHERRRLQCLVGEGHAERATISYALLWPKISNDAEKTRHCQAMFSADCAAPSPTDGDEGGSCASGVVRCGQVWSGDPRARREKSARGQRAPLVVPAVPHYVLQGSALDACVDFAEAVCCVSGWGGEDGP